MFTLTRSLNLVAMELLETGVPVELKLGAGGTSSCTPDQRTCELRMKFVKRSGLTLHKSSHYMVMPW